MKLTEIEKLFEKDGIIRGGLLLLKAPVAIRFIETCEEENIRILGIDAFRLIEDKIQPMQSCGRDFSISRSHEKEMNFELAKEFLKNYVDQDIYFEIVVDA